MLVNRQPAGDHRFTRQAPRRLYLKWCQNLDKSYILLVTPKKSNVFFLLELLFLLPAFNLAVYMYIQIFTGVL